MERLYTVREVQEILKVGRSFAYKLVQSGEIKTARVTVREGASHGP